MQSFSIPRSSADRLSRIALACSNERQTSPIANIGVRMTPDAVRFSATNGRILASFVVTLTNGDGPTGDLVLDSEQFTNAMKAASKGSLSAIKFEIHDQEVRVSNGIVTLVRRITGTYPGIEHCWSRPAGKRWIPSMSSIDPHLATIAQKIVGKTAVLFSSPVEPAPRLERMWESPKPDSYDDSLKISDLRSAVTAPGYFSDGDLAILLMPISRGAENRQLDLQPFAMMSQAEAVAA